MTIPCSFRGTVIETLHNPIVKANIMSKFLAETLLGKMPLVSSNKLFKSPSGHIFECCGIARAGPIKIEKTKIHLDFHILAILDFELLIGYPSEILFQEKSPYGSLNEEFGKIASTTHLDIPKVEHHPNNDLFEEVKFRTPFIHHHPRLNLSNVPRAIKMLFMIVVEIPC